MNEIRYFSMFTGVGGFELGLEGVNDLEKVRRLRETENLPEHGNRSIMCESKIRSNTFSPVGFSEIDKYASELLKQKWPEVRNYGNATKINPSELPDFDLLCGGFPCQAFSIAGKRRGFQDTRGTLFFDIARILEVKRPKIVFLENVKGLLNHEKGQTFKVIIQTLSELGYDVQWMVLNSKFFGVPQNRERVFIIGSLGGQPRPEILPFGQSSDQDNEKPRYTQYDLNFKGNRSQQYRIYDIEKPIGTLASSQAGDMKIKEKTIRRLTPTECERLQGFPDNWTEGFSDTQRYKMMGNAVTVNVIKAIAERLFQ